MVYCPENSSFYLNVSYPFASAGVGSTQNTRTEKVLCSISNQIEVIGVIPTIDTVEILKLRNDGPLNLMWEHVASGAWFSPIERSGNLSAYGEFDVQINVITEEINIFQPFGNWTIKWWIDNDEKRAPDHNITWHTNIVIPYTILDIFAMLTSPTILPEFQVNVGEIVNVTSIAVYNIGPLVSRVFKLQCVRLCFPIHTYLSKNFHLQFKTMSTFRTFIGRSTYVQQMKVETNG